jgi:hypothetical protein
MTTVPAWTQAEWTGRVAEPFRGDPQFWAGLAASADAVASLAAAIVAAVVLALSGDAGWALLAFVVPALLAGRAGLIGLGSSRRSREAFADRESWRAAERRAVATAFGPTLRRRRLARR